jgi:Transposase
LLGPERCAAITHVSAYGADFIDTIVAQMCPAATRVADPFHVVKWATEPSTRSVGEPGTTPARWPGPNRKPAGQATGRRTTSARGRTNEGVEGRALYVVEEPREPQRQPGDQSGLDRRNRLGGKPGPPTQRGPANDLRHALQRSSRSPRPVGVMGPTLPDPGVPRELPAAEVNAAQVRRVGYLPGNAPTIKP